MVSLVALALTIPSFLVLFVTGFVALGVLTLILSIAIALFFWWSQQPPLTVKEIEKTLVFQDAKAHRATVVRNQVARANQKGITEIWVGNIRTDGSIEKVLIDGQPPHYDEVRIGVRRVGKRYPRGLERGQEDRTTLSFDAVDSFTESTEVFEHVVTTKTKKLKVKITFHPDRPCRSARAFLQYGGQSHKPLKKPWISDDGSEILFEMRRPREGSEYAVEWTW